MTVSNYTHILKAIGHEKKNNYVFSSAFMLFKQTVKTG